MGNAVKVITILKLNRQYVGLDTIPVIIERFEKRGSVALGEYKDINSQIVEQILTLSA